MRLIIVRHGETNWNREGRVQGKKDIPMSKTGLMQAKILAKRLSKEKIDVIYTSKLKRAIRTAEEIKKNYPNAKLIKEKNLNEMSWGVFEGVKIADKRKRFKELLKLNLKANGKKDIFNFRVPKGESPKMLKYRVKKVLNKIIKKNKEKNVLIVGHGGVNRSILGILLKWTNEKILSTMVGNASITILSIKGKKVRMDIYNSNRHLF